MTHNTHDSQIQKNRQVRRVMFEWGSDLQKPHMIEHFFYTKRRSDAEAIARWAVARGYTVGDIHEQGDDQETRFSLVICAAACPGSEEFDQQTIEMEQLAIEYESTYDGWGTLVEE